MVSQQRCQSVFNLQDFLAVPSVEHTRGLLQAWHPVPMYQDALVSIPYSRSPETACSVRPELRRFSLDHDLSWTCCLWLLDKSFPLPSLCRSAHFHRPDLRLEWVRDRPAAGSAGHRFHPPVLPGGLHEPPHQRPIPHSRRAAGHTPRCHAVHQGRQRARPCRLLWRRSHPLHGTQHPLFGYCPNVLNLSKRKAYNALFLHKEIWNVY